MTNVYAAPESDVLSSKAATSPYYVVSVKKFLTLSIATMNFYLIYWFYRNWRQVKITDNVDVWPVMRGLFYIFFTYSLLMRVDGDLESKKPEYSWSPGAVTLAVVVLTLLTNVLGRLSSREIGSPATDFLSVLLVPVLALAAVAGQKAINAACDDPDGRGNANFTGANWAWIIFGVVFWLFGLLGLYLVFFAPELLTE
ncbi:MAG: hypothetical protein AB8G17_03460 [Gammaproteobacteria bacterium]